MSDVTVGSRDGVVVITLDRPQRRNALTPQMCDAIIDAIAAAEADPDVGALLFAAAGDDFCSGADLAVLRQAMPDPLAAPAYDDLGRIYDLFRAVVAARLPTVAAAQGSLVGAGMNLALACDVRVVADDVAFVGFGKAGVHPGGGHIDLLQQIDRQLAARLVLFNQPVHADEAVRTGLAWRAVPRGELFDTALEVARGATRDAALTRRVTMSFRSIADFAGHHDRAVHIERASQVWSLRRLADRS